MTEHPIIFSATMVAAIRDGQKTQTRRVITPQWSRCLDLDDPEDVAKALAQCPYGQVGDRLWVRETFSYVTLADNELSRPSASSSGIKNEFRRTPNGTPVLMLYRADAITEGWELPASWTPPIFMPRWASRLTLVLTDRQVQRVQDIVLEDIIAEGIPTSWCISTDQEGYKDFNEDEHRYLFKELWDKINAKRGYGWNTNPPVFALTFELVQQM